MFKRLLSYIMIVHHPAAARFHSTFDWLDSWHSFSFGAHYDPNRMGFRALRVINDDRIAGGGGFPTHGHRDMEILTWVLAGAVAHRDSTGGEGLITPGDLQGMSAGRGIRHSEFNASPKDPLRLLQIWLEPATRGLTPGYQQTAFPVAERSGRLGLLASADGRNGSLIIHAPAEVYSAVLATGEQLRYAIPTGRHLWLQVARGTLTANDLQLQEGDALAMSEEAALAVQATSAAEVLLFDLA